MINAYGIIPEDIRYNKNVSPLAKVLWSEIYAYNYAKIFIIHNKTLGDDLGVSSTHISRLIRELKENGLLLIFDSIQGRKTIVISNSKTSKKNIKEKPAIRKAKSDALMSFWQMLDDMKK